MLKLDMKKAYDRIEWDFLKVCLIKMGFCEKWTNWIMQCVSIVSLSIKLNGESLSFFQPSRGLRQGDPLSPYLFIMVANVLSILIKRALDEGSLKGIKLNPFCPTLSHLLFDDDSIFFLYSRITECQALATVLNQYCFALGQEINLNKSGIFFSSGTPIPLRANMAQELHVLELEKTSKHLIGSKQRRTCLLGY